MRDTLIRFLQLVSRHPRHCDFLPALDRTWSLLALSFLFFWPCTAPLPPFSLICPCHFNCGQLSVHHQPTSPDMRSWGNLFFPQLPTFNLFPHFLLSLLQPWLGVKHHAKQKPTFPRYTSLEVRGLRERLDGTQPQQAIHSDFWMSGFRNA